MKIAIVHDWLDTFRGGERVALELMALFKDADLYTLFYDPTKLPADFPHHRVKVRPSLNRFRPLRKVLLPLLPIAIEAIDLFEYDLVISSSSCVAKGVLTRPEALHVCYCHSPMRYVWDQREFYRPEVVKKWPLLSLIYRRFENQLRQWDVVSSQRVDAFVANSHFVSKRIATYYRRPAVVIPPPVDTASFQPTQNPKRDYILAAGALVPYKRFDLAVLAAEELRMPLIVAGSGPELSKLKRLGRHTTFIEHVDQKKMLPLMQNAKALLFPGIEDFGILPVEVLSAGTPVVALKAGGALDYVVDGQNGIFFDEPTVASVKEALLRLSTLNFDQKKVSQSAEKFSKSYFQTRLLNAIKSAWQEKNGEPFPQPLATKAILT